MMGNPVRRASASSSASRAGRGGTSSSRYAATRGAKRFMFTPPSPVGQEAVFRQIAQGCRALPRLLVQPRQVEVRVRQPSIGGDRLLVGLQDRKSTRLNSSHTVISYAVFCLKKKKEEKHITIKDAS